MYKNSGSYFVEVAVNLYENYGDYFSLASFPGLSRFCACLVRPASSLSCESLGSPNGLALPLSLVGPRARDKQARDRKTALPTRDL